MGGITGYNIAGMDRLYPRLIRTQMLSIYKHFGFGKMLSKPYLPLRQLCDVSAASTFDKMVTRLRGFPLSIPGLRNTSTTVSPTV